MVSLIFLGLEEKDAGDVRGIGIYILWSVAKNRDKTKREFRKTAKARRDSKCSHLDRVKNPVLTSS